MKSRRSARRAQRYWALYVGLSLLLTGALAWSTRVTLELEQREHAARVRASTTEKQRRVLWRLDSWLAPLLAREAARAPAEYQPYLEVANPNAALTLNPSPLLKETHPIFPLYFETTAGSVESCSPQLPESPAQVRDSLNNGYLTQARISSNRTQLAEVSQLLQGGSFWTSFESEEAAILETLQVDPFRAGKEVDHKSSRVHVDRDIADRRRNFQALQANIADSNDAVWGLGKITAGPLVPLWLTGAQDDGRLLFLRRLQGAGPDRIQGFVANWEKLERALSREVADVGEVRFEPRRPDSPESAVLASIPVEVEVEPVDLPFESASLRSLQVTWLVVTLGLVCLGLGLRTMLAYAERRRLFASAVTHELRTPLTTFQLYSDMLAGGLVEDDAKRARYAETLRAESNRLSRIVENVLLYSQLEEGGPHAKPSRLSVDELKRRLIPGLEKFAEENRVTLELNDVAEAESGIVTDPSLCEQILLNLLDNAAKYAQTSEGVRVELDIRAIPGSLLFSIRDHGPGLPRAQGRQAFRAFERAGRESGNIAGVGLGLALSRAFAQQLGGDLFYEAAEPGARFTLSLPRT